MVQKPLQSLIGNNIFAVAILYVIISLFWCVGIHGNNMVAAVKEPIFRPLLYANTAAYTAGATQKDIPYVMNLTMLQMFGEFGGSGVTIGLVIAILIFSKWYPSSIEPNPRHSIYLSSSCYYRNWLYLSF